MPEFCRLLKPEEIAALPSKQMARYEIHATPEECRALAQRFHLESLDSLDAALEIKPWNDGGARIQGELHGKVVQRCVVSLKPIPQEVSERFESFFAPPEGFANFRPELQPVEREDPESIDAEGIDLGELVAQQLSLALDPYPHLPDASFPDESRATQQPANSPFAPLSKLTASASEKQGC